MAFTELLFVPGYAEGRVAEAKKNLKENRGTDDFVGFGLQIIGERLRNEPRSYVEYGPYWWALKKVLIAHEMAPGSIVDEEVAAVYCGKTEEETMILADDFRDRIYQENFPTGTRYFLLDADGEGEYVLNDPDYERVARQIDDIQLI